VTQIEFVERVRHAFREELARPPIMTLRGANDVDSYDLPTPFDPSADVVTDSYIERHGFWGLSHLDARSWRHYLPALIDYALRRPDDPAMVTEALIRSLRPPDPFPPRLGSLDTEQEAVVRTFLETIARGEIDRSFQQDAQQALDEWWGPNPRSRPTVTELEALRRAPITYRDVREDIYRLQVPDTLPSSGLRDIPSEFRRVQTWGGYVCGDVSMMIAINAVLRTAHSFDQTIARYATFFGLPVEPRRISVAGARLGARVEGMTPVVSSSGPERVVMIVADAGDIVTLTIRAAEREDVLKVMEHIASSFAVTGG
jgi:hypothetical protein